MNFRGGSPLAKMPPFIIEARIKLLLQYTETFLSFNRYYLEFHSNKPGTLSEMFKRGKSLVVPQRLLKNFSDKLQKAEKNRYHENVKIEINRKLAMSL